MPLTRAARTRLATALALSVLLPAVPASAQGSVRAGTGGSVRADTAGCVTLAEYRAARHGMTKPRVHGIFDTRGTRLYLLLDNEERRAYRMCDPSLWLTVVYLRGRLGYTQLRDT